MKQILFINLLLILTLTTLAEEPVIRRFVKQMPSESYIWIDDNDCETNLKTVINEIQNKFPLVGGTLQATENVIRKYIIVSTRITKMNAIDGKGNPLTFNPKPSQLTQLNETYKGNTPFEYCIIDCTNLTYYQFQNVDINFLPLNINKTYYARPCVIYKNQYIEYGKTKKIIYAK